MVQRLHGWISSIWFVCLSIWERDNNHPTYLQKVTFSGLMPFFNGTSCSSSSSCDVWSRGNPFSPEGLQDVFSHSVTLCQGFYGKFTLKGMILLIQAIYNHPVSLKHGMQFQNDPPPFYNACKQSSHAKPAPSVVLRLRTELLFGGKKATWLHHSATAGWCWLMLSRWSAVWTVPEF